MKNMNEIYLEEQLKHLDKTLQEERKNYIQIIEEITDASTDLLLQSIKYIELYKEYGEVENKLFEDIQGYINTTRNLAQELTKINNK